MAMSPAEKQKKYRDDQKEKERKQSLIVSDVFRAPFFEYLEEIGFHTTSDFSSAFDLAGIPMPRFEDDFGPAEHTLDFPGDPVAANEFFSDVKGSLGRAEAMVGYLIDAAVDLATHVNEFKKAEIKARISEIEASDLSELAAKKAALNEVARLSKILDHLDKKVRWTFDQWRTIDKSK